VTGLHKKRSERRAHADSLPLIVSAFPRAAAPSLVRFLRRNEKVVAILCERTEGGREPDGADNTDDFDTHLAKLTSSLPLLLGHEARHEMATNSAIPLDNASEEPVLIAFTVHGLGSSSSRVGMLSEGPSQQREAPPKKGWLSHLNNAVVGDRQDTVTL